jgi:hypothetical protein
MRRFSDLDMKLLERELRVPRYHKRIVYVYYRNSKPPFQKYDKMRFWAYTHAEEIDYRNRLRDLGWNNFCRHWRSPKKTPPEGHYAKQESFIRPPKKI